MNGSPHRAVADDRRVRMMAMGGACLWVGFFVVLLRPSPSPVAASLPAPARLRYVSASSVAPVQGQPAGLWSPQLFSLPSSFGFSGLLEIQENGLRPRLDPPEAESAFLEASTPVPGQGPDTLAPQVRSFFGAQFRRNRASSGAAAPLPLDVQILEGFAREDFINWPLPPDLTAKKGWQAMIEIEVQPGGEVSHVFVMNETHLGRNRGGLVRAVRQWRLKPALETRRGLLAVRSTPPEGGIQP